MNPIYKNIALNVILYVGVAALLIYSAIGYWKEGKKFITILTVIVVILTLWQGIDNAKELKTKLI